LLYKLIARLNVLSYDHVIDNCIRHYHPSDPADVKQDVYLVLLSNHLDQHRNIPAYIFKVVRSIVFSRLRKKIIRNLATKSIDKHILICEETIPKVSNELLLHAQGYRYAEIAKKTGLSVTCLRSRVFEERKKLKKREI
jgi:DNA-directed RNA polymerase specialized sigma24 family protein